jgi:hypothetical protein
LTFVKRLISLGVPVVKHCYSFAYGGAFGTSPFSANNQAVVLSEKVAYDAVQFCYSSHSRIFHSLVWIN